MNNKILALSSSIFFIVIFLSGCTGRMGQIRKELSGDPQIYVASNNSDIKLHLSGLAGGEIIGQVAMPEEFKLISYAIADTFAREFDNADIKTEKDERIPEIDSGSFFDNGKIPDWSKTKYTLLISSSVTITYFVKSSSGGIPPYSYRLGADSKMTVRRIIGGRVEMPQPSEDDTVSLGSAEKRLSISTGQIRGLNSLMKKFPPSLILGELEEMTKKGVKRFIKDLES